MRDFEQNMSHGHGQSHGHAHGSGHAHGQGFEKSVSFTTQVQGGHVAASKKYHDHSINEKRYGVSNAVANAPHSHHQRNDRSVTGETSFSRANHTGTSMILQRDGVKRSGHRH